MIRNLTILYDERRAARIREPRVQSDGVIVVANRAPIRHERGADGQIVTRRSASGLVTALEPLVTAYGGSWVAHGAGSADVAVVDERGGLDVPAGRPRYRIRYVSLEDNEERGYYYGFANEGLWPLCHVVPVNPVFRRSDFDMYQRVNNRFATAVAQDSAGEFPIVLVQDYHFALAPRSIRRQLPSSVVVAFWHIPWPAPEVLASCPWHRQLLIGLLGSDIVGFQTPADCLNFLAGVGTLLGADVDHAQRYVSYDGHETLVRAYPVGVEWDNDIVRMTPASRVCREKVCRELHLPTDVRLAVGIDRLDYTKGINEKFLAVERLLETHSELRGRFVLLQVAEPSRDCLPAYQAARAQLLDTSRRVNARFATSSYRPIELLEAHHEPFEVYRFYRAADLCYVGSLHDGMNLVAKEFVCARHDGRGVLVLSQFAGAAQQLRDALLVNPHDIETSAARLAEAVDMPISEQATRMERMRQIVAKFDTSWWAHQLMQDAQLQRNRSAKERRHAARPQLAAVSARSRRAAIA